MRPLQHVLVALGLVVIWAAPAHAQEQAAAEALFRSAREAAERGDWVTACDRFEESNRLEPAPGTVLNLAKCREELGQIASAWKRYREVVQRLPPSDLRVAYAKKREAELAAEVPHLTLIPPDGEGELRVKVNEMEVSKASFGVPLPLDPGEVRIVVSAEGREDWTERFKLEAGERVTRELAFGPRLPEPRERPSSAGAGSAPGERSAQGTLGWTALGIGGAGLLAGAGGMIWAFVESQTVADPAHCDAARCDQVGFDASQRGQSAVVLGWIGLGVGALGLGLGTYLLATDDGKTLSVSARPSWDGAMLTIGGRL